MRKLLLPRLALSNIRKNRQTYLPYMLTCIGTIMMFYILYFISNNEGLADMPGCEVLQVMLMLGCIIIGVFSAIFLFYTNSFLIKRRKREFGLYNILGMAKRHILIILFFETLFTGAFSLLVGLAGGVLGSKLMLLVLMQILEVAAPFGFSVSVAGLETTAVLFGCIFLATLLFNLRQIHIAKPVELLRGGQVGEREPKTKWLLVLLGLVSLGGGYTLALTVTSPVEAIFVFFLAVLLVMIGTYALFTAGSIAVLKLLRKNKRYYYQTKHFTSISGLLYRMKQNAVGLGNICILSTAVLVTLSTTVCLYLGMEDLLNARFPYRITVSSSDASARNLKAVNTALDAALDTAGLPVVQRVQYRYRSFPAALENGTLTNRTTFSSAPCQAYFLTLDDYNQLVRQSCRLEPGETMLFMQRGRYDADEIELYGDSYRIVERLDVFPIEGMASAMMNDACVFVLPDEAAVEAVYRSHMDGEPANEGYNNHWGVDVEGEPEQVLPLFEDLYGRLEDTDAYVECRDEAKTSFYALYGGFLFLGIFIGAVFLMATVLIIYYKQISEGYEDKARFAIMQKVGMTQREIKQTIRSQILLVFFLPLAAAVVHIAVAFKVMTKMLFALNLTNVALFALCTVGTILIFVLFYALVYALTARAYYKIVK